MDENSTANTVNAEATQEVAERISTRNLIMFPLGTVGRDFLYQLFSSYLLTFILFTKNLTDAQFASVSIIIIVARIFDAFNDPIMGGVVENTRSRWGKFKPWMLIGAVLTGGVVMAVFSVQLQGWGFIGFLAVMYLLFSITFTMNDISYWGMLPSLTTNEHDRNKLTSFAQICASIGIGLSSLLIPSLTAGQFTLGGSSVKAYMYIAVIAALIMISFQMFTLFGVKEKPIDVAAIKAPRMSLKQMFKVLFKNDQLMWCALILLLFNIGNNIVSGGLSMTYIYFEFGYQGTLFVAFGILFAAMSTIFTLVFPWLSKRFGRDKLLASTVYAQIIGYLVMLVAGLAMPSGEFLSAAMIAKFAVMALGWGVVGYGQGFYMIMVINIANTVEYNEWKTGNRDEGLIFSIRPFTAKMGSALMQFIVMLVYLAVGVTAVTNGISDLENAASRGELADADKLTQIQELLATVSNSKKIALLCCMCLIPIAFMVVTFIIYKKKCFLNEETHARIIREIAARKAAESEEGETNEPSDNENVIDEGSKETDGEFDVEEDISDVSVAEGDLVGEE